MINLILGGVRSGKSRQAEQLATKSNRPVIYIATATAGDEEMRQRIEVHRTQRPSTWTTVEVPFVLAEALQQHAQKECCIIVIRDHGAGVEEALLSQICDPFFRGSSQSEGYGLGLSIAVRAVERLGGELKLRNHPEGGLEVSIQLPCGERN